MQQSTPTVPGANTQNMWDYFDPNVPSDLSNHSGGHLDSPPDAVPAPDQTFVLGMYSALLTTGAIGNVAVFTSLMRSRKRKSRVNLLMTHLVIADMIVTFIVIPLEIGWRTTNAWLAGNFACKFFMVLRAFGLYLSSNVLVCISFDRFFAVLYPLRLPIARKRSKTMLTFAWFVALLCSLPQSVVFKVMRHPNIPDFEQCVSFEAFSDPKEELMYNVFGLCAMYFLPLLIITVCYSCIFHEISKNSKEISDKCRDSENTANSKIHLRRSDQRPLARARRRTLKMTVTIVTVFACCWLPYVTMTLWYMLDRQSASNVSGMLQDFLFLMAVSNSCMDPLVYGSYTLELRESFGNLKKLLNVQRKPKQKPETYNPTPGARTSNVVNHFPHPPKTTRSSGSRRKRTMYEETSLCEPAANSDPVHHSVSSLDERAIRHSSSCEIFALYTPQQNFD